MSSRRFYCATPINRASEYLLEGPEHQHLAKVLRAKPGDEVTLFDGSGGEYRAIVNRVDRHATLLTEMAFIDVDREPVRETTLAVALPKGERQQWLVEKAVELGVKNLLPLITEFGVAQPNEKARHRIERQIISASKQCGRNHLMTLLPAGELITVLADDPTSPQQKILAHPNGQSMSELSTFGPTEPLLMLIGPEGGFSEREIELAIQAKCQMISLGSRILRIETAALVLASRFIYA